MLEEILDIIPEPKKRPEILYNSGLQYSDGPCIETLFNHPYHSVPQNLNQHFAQNVNSSKPQSAREALVRYFLGITLSWSSNKWKLLRVRRVSSLLWMTHTHTRSTMLAAALMWDQLLRIPFFSSCHGGFPLMLLQLSDFHARELVPYRYCCWWGYFEWQFREFGSFWFAFAIQDI